MGPRTESSYPIRVSATIALLSFSLCGGAFASLTYYVPQVLDGPIMAEGKDFYQTTFTIVNLSGEEVTVTLNLTTDDGEPFSRLCNPWVGTGLFCSSKWDYTIDPHGHRNISTVGESCNGAGCQGSPDALVGWALLEAPEEVELVTTLYLRRALETDTSGAIITATVLPTTALQESLSFSALLNVNQASTGMALLNPSPAESATVKIKLYQDGEVFAERTISLPPLGKIAQFLNEGELFNELDFFSGIAEVSSSLPLASAVILAELSYWIGFPVFTSRE